MLSQQPYRHDQHSGVATEGRTGVWREPVNTDKRSWGRMHNCRFALLAVVGAGLLTILAACSSPAAPATATPNPNSSEVASTTAAPHNKVDVAFAQMMIIHHEGATDMAGLAQQTSSNGQVRELAERINAAQGPEINQMRGWLEEWGEPAPEDSDMSGMARDGMDTGGTDQQAAMNALLKLDGTAFDKKFLSLMVAHHRGALAMATQQVSDGQNAAGIELAKSIIATQQSEIAEMQTLLGKLE